MSCVRPLAISLSLLLAAGCSSGSGAVAPLAPQQPPSAPLVPAGSSAAQHILGGIDASRAAQHRDEGAEDDDGGWRDLRMPVLQSCGNGIVATDCGVWTFTNGGGGRVPRSAATPLANAPVLNFCRDTFPVADLGVPAQPVSGLVTSAFYLAYTGTKPAPIVTFATRWWDVSVANTFTGNGTVADPVTFAPVVTNSAYRGWLVFFTWSWPADILAIPFAVNEIQLAAASAPLAIPAGGSATLGAFDCLGRPIMATAVGSGFGFNPDHSGTRLTSAGPELNVAVYGGANPNGAMYLSDDHGARTVDPVAATAPTPQPTATPIRR
ncbi:MAG: hypothetical protein M3169_16950 [Candidatus Eremiobacteraeota bacterium]|nr:hypothetical protein [Candidatus Eremiobacteraeota bacterium]